MIIRIEVSRDFSRTPGARYKEHGQFSGEEFREEHLLPALEKCAPDGIVEVVLDGTAGYATSFLEEAFGGFARKLGKDICLRRLRLIADENPKLVGEIWSHIEDARS
jgi:hypothetical protein